MKKDEIYAEIQKFELAFQGLENHGFDMAYDRDLVRKLKLAVDNENVALAVSYVTELTYRYKLLAVKIASKAATATTERTPAPTDDSVSKQHRKRDPYYNN
jgi:hypothetical protein